MFESHITIDNNSTVTAIDEFVSLCDTIQCRAVVIENDSGSGEATQVMTAKFHNTDDILIVYEEVAQLKASLLTNGYKILRSKIEYILGKNKEIPAWIQPIYYEFHSKFEVPLESHQQFIGIIKKFHPQTHVSQNARKSSDFWFVTSRHEFEHNAVISLLIDFRLVNTIRECVVYDDNKDLDQGWLPCLECPIKKGA